MEKTLNRHIADRLWSPNVADAPLWRRKLVGVLRYMYVALDDLALGELTLRAMSLVYTSLLAFVPMLAVSFSVLKAMGMHEKQLEPLLLRFLEPLGEQGLEITSRVIGFIDNIKIGVLGGFGIALLFYTAISLVQKIEASFNHVWRLEQQRSLARRFADYGSVLMIGPVLIFSAVGLSAKVLGGAAVQEAARIEVVAWLLAALQTATPYLLVIAAFTFLYMFIPNTRVTFRAGIIGGAVSGVLWQTLGWGFGSVVVSATDSGTYVIYSGFAVLVLFMVWLYISWLIVLVGSSISFYVQHPEFVLPSRRDASLSIAQRELLALKMMALIARHHYGRMPPWNARQLARALKVPVLNVSRILAAMRGAGLLVESSDDPARFVPRVPLEQTNAKVVLDALRSIDELPASYRRSASALAEVDELSRRIDGAVAEALAEVTLKDLAGVDKREGDG